ncbi:hypothetical protein H2201_008363 [Coniosporium apollinis]|uniref:CorA-like transporter domain-containing protein n=1 Tax=Coniosporium apollinis TaxID=61459 RepID=A0ABQ9NJ98_9PEZI|nr:hypothetical protein H2201_008363 [Coniosporium apollinis]
MPASLQLPADFVQSYSDFENYPCNLIYRSSFPDVLREYKSRLYDAASTLLTDPTKPSHYPRKRNEPVVKVPFRDWNADQGKFDKQNILHKPNLDGVAELKRRTWSIRQAAFHHQFDVEEGTTLWISTKGGLDDLKERVESLTGPNGRLEDRSFGTTAECFRSSLAVHLMYCHWSTEGWRWYIEFLEDAIETETRKAVIEPNNPARPYSPRDLQTVQAYEDKTNEAIMILEANLDVMTSLRGFYEALLKNKAFPLTTETACFDGVNMFAAQINNMIHDFKMHIARAKLLIRISADRKSLILQHLQSQATQKMEDLTSMSHKEAIVMRIITIVTLIYLPATFVSTFFSTDIIKYENPNGGSASFSKSALERWLQVTLPLTALTLFIGWIGFKRAYAKRKSERLPSYTGEVKTL